MATVQITGSGIFQFARAQNRLDIVAESLNQFMFDRVRDISEDKGAGIAKAISIEANKAFQGMLPFIANEIFGRFSGASDKTLTAFHFGARGEASGFGLASRDAVNLTWTQLQRKYLQSKQKQGKPGFFTLTGELQKAFMEAGAQRVKTKLGYIEASYNPTASRANIYGDIELGVIEVNLRPTRSISASRFLGPLTTGRVSNAPDVFNRRESKRLDAVIFSDRQDVVAKLQNKGKPARKYGRFAGRAYRPILQPAIAVWLLQRIPQAVRNVLRRVRIE